jgi:hypothetical protein
MTQALPPLARFFCELVDRRAPLPGRAGFAQATEGAGVPFDHEVFLGAFAAMARQLGRTPLDLKPEENAYLQTLGIDWPIGGWGMDELGRVMLLLVAARLPEAEFRTLVEQCYQQGDNRERQAVLRALPLLPRAASFLPLAVEACRTNIQPIFEAIACENPYPAVRFSELNFNQMVLKALFMGVPLKRIIGLEGRITPELMRMAHDYASERLAAGRSVPADLWYLTADRGSPP